MLVSGRVIPFKPGRSPPCSCSSNSWFRHKVHPVVWSDDQVTLRDLLQQRLELLNGGEQEDGSAAMFLAFETSGWHHSMQKHWIMCKSYQNQRPTLDCIVYLCPRIGKKRRSSSLQYLLNKTHQVKECSCHEAGLSINLNPESYLIKHILHSPKLTVSTWK